MTKEIAPCVWCGLEEMEVYASFNGKDICVFCEDNEMVTK